MKRIYENIPLQSVLYCISGLQKIRIEDRTSNRYPYGDSVVLFDGRLNDFNHTDFFNEISRYKVEHTTVQGIEADRDGKMIFTICTTWEQY